MGSYMIKREYDIWTQTNKLSKSELIDAVVELLEDSSDSVTWSTESCCIIEAFKKMNGKKINTNSLGTTKKSLLEGGVPKDEIVKVFEDM